MTVMVFRASLLFLLMISIHTFAAERVSVIAYSEVAVYLDRQVSARVESLDESVLSAEISARVQTIQVRPGEYVESGQKLLEMDPSSFTIERDAARARLEVAEAGLDMARLRAERARRLAPEKFVSEDDLLEAETRLRQAVAESEVARQSLATAELMRERTVIRAPFAGVVGARLLGTGALASPGTPLLELISLDELEISAGISPELVDGLRQAERIEFVSGGQRWPVRVARIPEVISRGSRTVPVRFQFKEHAPAPGREGRLVWTDTRPAVPADYIIQRNGELGVLIFDEDDGTVGFIRLPEADAGRPHRADLPGETLLIDEGRQRVQPGDPVERR